MTDVFITLQPPCWCPSKGHEHGVFMQSSINLGDTSANSARTKNSRDLILAKVVYISIYRISDSCRFSLNGYDFYFDLMTGETGELFTKGEVRKFSSQYKANSELQAQLLLELYDTKNNYSLIKSMTKLEVKKVFSISWINNAIYMIV